MKNNQFLDPIDIAERLGVSKRTVLDLVRKGALAGYRFGSQIKVDADSVTRFIEKSRMKGTVHG